MKVILDGKEIELDTELEEGAIELDKITPVEIDMDDTIEITDDLLEKITEEVGIESHE